MKKYAFFRYCVVFLIIVLPYLMGAGINGTEMVMEQRKPEMEAFLPVIVSSQISAEMKKEAINAPTIIARSNLQRQKNEGNNLAQILKDNGDSKNFLKAFFEGKEDIYKRAAKETQGLVLTWRGKAKLTPWHKVSAGKTRSGEEALGDKSYTYLKSVNSSADKNCPGYLKTVEISKEQLSGELKIKKRDSAGYVTELLNGKTLLEGESFAAGMGLDSSNFSLQKKGNVYFLRVRGCGHGIGFSQYGGNEMAKEGSSAEEILKKYFPAMKLEKIPG